MSKTNAKKKKKKKWLPHTKNGHFKKKKKMVVARCVRHFWKMVVARWLWAFFKKPQIFWLKHYGRPEKVYMYDNPEYVTLRPFAYIFLQLVKMGQKHEVNQRTTGPVSLTWVLRICLNQRLLRKRSKHSPRVGADNPVGPKFWCQQEGLITMVICCKFKKNLFNRWLYTHLFMI